MYAFGGPSSADKNQPALEFPPEDGVNILLNIIQELQVSTEREQELKLKNKIIQITHTLAKEGLGSCDPDAIEKLAEVARSIFFQSILEDTGDYSLLFQHILSRADTLLSTELSEKDLCHTQHALVYMLDARIKESRVTGQDIVFEEPLIRKHIEVIIQHELPTKNITAAEHTRYKHIFVNSRITNWALCHSQDAELRKKIGNAVAESIISGNTYQIRQILDAARNIFRWNISAQDKEKPVETLFRLVDDIPILAEANPLLQEKMFGLYEVAGLNPKEWCRALIENAGKYEYLFDKIEKATVAPGEHAEIGINIYDVLLEQIKNIQALEQSERGTPRILHKEFGIECFFRYPPSLLLHQAQNRDNTGLQYGLCINPKTDYNGAFVNKKYNIETESPVYRFADSLIQQGWGMRIYEVSGARDLYRTLRAAAKKYKNGPHASFLILAGHGDENQIQLGPDKYGLLTKKELSVGISGFDEERNHWLKDLFKGEWTAIFDSCSTGEYSGITEQLLKVEGVVSYAPRISASLENIEPIFTNNRTNIQLNVTFFSEGGEDVTRQLISHKEK